jgi:hypothetical protein
MMVAAVAKLGRAFAAQVEALRKLKNGGITVPTAPTSGCGPRD